MVATMNDDNEGAKKKKARRKAPKRFSGLALLVHKGQAYLVAQGIEQVRDFDLKKTAQFIEVGVSQTIAFKVTPGEVIHIACGLLENAAFHFKECARCNELVIQTAVDIGALEEADGTR